MNELGFEIRSAKWVRRFLSLFHSHAFVRLGTTADQTTTIFSLLDAVKGQLWSDFIDNPLSKCQTILTSNASTSTISQYTTPLSQSATALILQISDNYVTNEFLDCEQCRSLYICSKYIPIDLLLTRLLVNLNTSNGIHETRRALYFIFGFILFRRRSSTCYLLEEILPYLINIKSNDFMLEPNVYHMCLLMNVLLVLEFSSSDDQLGQRFRVKTWREFSASTNVWSSDFNEEICPKYDDTRVTDAFHNFFTWASNELFSSDNVRPVNYFLGWLQTVLWMFSRTAKVLKPFIKSKLVRRRETKPKTFFSSFQVAQLSEYISLQFPIEKVLSILDLSNSIELDYASMAITRDYTRLQTSTVRSAPSLIQQSQSNMYEANGLTAPNLTKLVQAIPKNL